MTLNLGDQAPQFSLTDDRGNRVNLSDLLGQRVVLYFYPRDNTPGCTKEAQGFRDAYPEYQRRHIVILGVSTDDAKSHAKFVKKYDLPFPLLCDENATVSSLYESYGLKKFMGKEFMGIYRSTFVIDPNGKIEKIYRKVKPDNHANLILSDLDELPS
jgi:thioredoxin-dependent peroxiredoxin